MNTLIRRCPLRGLALLVAALLIVSASDAGAQGRKPGGRRPPVGIRPLRQNLMPRPQIRPGGRFSVNVRTGQVLRLRQFRNRGDDRDRGRDRARARPGPRRPILFLGNFGLVPTPFVTGGYNPYMYPSGYGGGYGSGYQAGGSEYGDSQYAPREAQLTSQTEERRASLASLDALGLPNEDGRLTWPVALEVLGPTEETKPLRNQVEALIQMALEQSASGTMKPAVWLEANRAINELRQRLQLKGYSLSRRSVVDAEQFLDKLEKSLYLIQ